MTSTAWSLKPREKVAVAARDLSSQINERTRGMRESGEAAIAEAFKGITAGGEVVAGLFPVESSGVSTQALREG